MDPNSICRKSRRLAGKQREICRKEIEIVEEVANGAKLALGECQYQFRDRKWNCTTSRRMLSRVLKTGKCKIDTGPVYDILMTNSLVWRKRLFPSRQTLLFDSDISQG